MFPLCNEILVLTAKNILQTIQTPLVVTIIMKLDGFLYFDVLCQKISNSDKYILEVIFRHLGIGLYTHFQTR